MYLTWICTVMQSKKLLSKPPTPVCLWHYTKIPMKSKTMSVRTDHGVLMRIRWVRSTCAAPPNPPSYVSCIPNHKFSASEQVSNAQKPQRTQGTVTTQRAISKLGWSSLSSCIMKEALSLSVLCSAWWGERERRAYCTRPHRGRILWC